MTVSGPPMAGGGLLSVEALRTLRLAPSADGVSHLSAASGLALVGDLAYVVADDEHALGLFDRSGDAPGQLLTLFDEGLPGTYDERKARKADLEALAVLPPLDGLPHGALLAIGSGSKPNRCRGALMALDALGVVAGDARAVDFTDLYLPLRAHFPELNIEGLFVTGGALCLLQRGSKVSPANACIRFDLVEFGRWLVQAGAAPQAASIEDYPLGSIAGVPLTFTDGAGLPGPAGGWVFCAAAEDTGNSYLDGACAGSAVGMVDSHGVLHGPFTIAAPAKVEGIALDPRGTPGTVLLVTDADDRQTPACLLRANLATVMPFGFTSAS